MTVEQVRSTLYSAFGGREVSTIFTPTNDYRVILEVAAEDKEDPSALSRLYVRSDSGALVPLDAIARVGSRRRRSASRIRDSCRR